MCLETNFLQNIKFRQVDSWNIEEITESGLEHYYRSIGFQPMQKHIHMIYKGGTN